MLDLNFEFRKGIFFLRLIGDLNKESYNQKKKEIESLIIDNKFKYIVINTNGLNSIDLSGISCILKICSITKENQSNTIICDKYKMFKKMLNNNFPNINDEIEVL